MLSNEKINILLAAVQVAATNGFNFSDWYEKQLNISSYQNIDTDTRIKSLCKLGVERTLVFDHEFLKALVGENYLQFIGKMAVQQVPVNALKTYLILIGEWEEANA
jgi:hypothetical protein